MSAHFKWYPASEEVVVPWNARYSFPSQSNKAVKITPRIPPKNGAVFAPGQVMRLEFPAQGYVNPLNTTLEFDVTLFGPGGTTGATRFQNNIQSIFSRVRLLYGATPLEDMINYNVIVRSLTEWTATNTQMTMDQTSIAEGIGGVIVASDNDSNFGVCNVRQKYIQGISVSSSATGTAMVTGTSLGNVPTSSSAAVPAGVVGNGQTAVTRRYQVNFALGLFTQDKLIPTKFMASQLAIEITLEQAAACIFSTAGSGTQVAPTYGVGNVNLIPEILEFDASYDSMFLAGLRDGGVPLKFSSWHTFIFSSGMSGNINLLVQERSRSVKALFAVQRRQQPNFAFDSGATLFDTSSNGQSSLQTYQFRIGGRYFPAAPVQCASNVGGAISNGGAEAFVELTKALNITGDYRLSSGCNTIKWASQNAAGVLQEFDYGIKLLNFGVNGVPTIDFGEAVANSFGGDMGSQCFAMAVDLETSNGVEISGLNAEEQSDIALIANWTSAQVTGNAAVPSSLEVYSYYDAMIVLRENNVLELIQ
jgi:hypothetical protein